MDNKNLKKAIFALNTSIVALTLITATAHIWLGTQPGEDLGFWFLLNGLGSLGLLIIFFLPMLKSFHKIIGWALLGYTLLTIIMWFILGSPSEGTLDPFDVTIKAVELALVIQLFLESKLSSH